MAGSSSKWTTLGSNTNSTINTDSAAEANIDISSNGGINAQVRHECHMWLVDGADTSTQPFDWAIDTDFTVVVNSAKQTLSDPGNVDVDIEGSVDGVNYIKMADVMTWDAGAATVGQGVYDYEASGRMPFMRVTLDGDAVDNSDAPIKINIFMHGI
tara:strand:- start:1459 stop:1926 length:468 start_codon:yes stop_codon:yes gene_type:complete